MMPLERLRAGDFFEEETFEELDLSGLDLGGKELCRCVFRGCKLAESRWSRARLEDCLFEGCDLTHMVPSDLRASGVRFQRCKMLGVEWTSASLSLQIAFEECDLRYCAFVALSLRMTPFLRCKATEAHFLDVDLTGADFSGTDLTGSTFRGATLARADLSTAHGVFLDPARNRVKDVQIGVESAVLLASSFGMKVSEFHRPAESPAAGKRGRRR